MCSILGSEFSTKYRMSYSCSLPMLMARRTLLLENRSRDGYTNRPVMRQRTMCTTNLHVVVVDQAEWLLFKHQAWQFSKDIKMTSANSHTVHDGRLELIAGITYKLNVGPTALSVTSSRVPKDRGHSKAMY